MSQNLTDVHSDEHQHLIEALIGMEKVAEHINEMQVDDIAVIIIVIVVIIIIIIIIDIIIIIILILVDIFIIIIIIIACKIGLVLEDTIRPQLQGFSLLFFKKISKQ